MKDLKDMSLAELWQLFPIVLEPHNPAYAAWYQEEQDSLRHILQGFSLCRISHIGSTAVAGLLAKPIVDILLELPLGYDMDAVVGLLQQNRWIVMKRDDSGQTMSWNKGYTPQGFARRVFHLHIRPLGDWDELYFRDYLRQYPGVAQQYGGLKTALKKVYEQDWDGYTDAKSEFVARYTREARAAFGGRYLPEQAEK